MSRTSISFLLWSLTLAQLLVSTRSERSVYDMRYVQRATRLLNAALHIPAHVLPGLEQLDDDGNKLSGRSFKRTMPDPEHSHGIFLPHGHSHLVGIYTPKSKQIASLEETNSITDKMNGKKDHFYYKNEMKRRDYSADSRPRRQRLKQLEPLINEKTIEKMKIGKKNGGKFRQMGQRRGIRDFFSNRRRRRPNFPVTYTITTLTTTKASSNTVSSTTNKALPYEFEAMNANFTSSKASSASSSLLSSSTSTSSLSEPRSIASALKSEMSERLAYEELLEIYKAIRKRHKKDPHLLDDFPLVVKEALARAFLSKPESYIEDLRRKERLKSSLLKSGSEMRIEHRLQTNSFSFPTNKPKVVTKKAHASNNFYSESKNDNRITNKIRHRTVIYDPYGPNNAERDEVERDMHFIDGAINDVKLIKNNEFEKKNEKKDDKWSNLHMLDHMATEDPLKNFVASPRIDSGTIDHLILKPTLNRPPTQRYIRFT